ncbi:MAG: serine hydrolase [Oceanicaulis sp.]
MRRFLLGAAGVLALGAAAGLVWLNGSDTGRIYLPTATGLTAKQACSMTFVSGLEPERALALYVHPLLGGAAGLVSANVDETRREATASILGLFWRQRAVYREGLGCTLVHGGDDFDASASLEPLPPAPMALNAGLRDAAFDTGALNAALDAAFTEDGRNTLAALVLYDGELVAERYADGVGPDTPLHGWSMTKSLAATMAGVLAQRGLIDIHAEGQIPALAEAGRPEITIHHLLTMTGGLAGYELNDGTDPNSDMLFTEPDMAGFAATRAQIAAPGERWDYQSGNTILAGAGLEPRLGDTPQARVAAVREMLFEPLNMGGAIVEPDEAGTLKWSSYMYAPARDWARMGQLYIDGGRAPDGEQIIPEAWADYVSTPTPGSNGNYGSGFWMYETGLPEDTFIMNGFQGQYAFVIPSEDLVIVRLGATNFQSDGAIDFANAVLASRRDTAPSDPAEEEDAEAAPSAP